MSNVSRIEKAWETLQQEGSIGLVRKLFRYAIKIKNNEINPIINYYKNRLRFRAVARPHKVIWIKTKDIKLWVKDDKIKRKKHGAGEIRDGDWDLDTNIIEHQMSFIGKSIISHFKDGIPWEETDMFQNYYVKALQRKGVVLGCRNIQELINYYNDKIDGLYYSMKKNGVLLRSKDRWEIDFMYVHISRGGEAIYTSGGNHRLFIAMQLNINYIPVKVWWRHKKWQEIRDKLSVHSGQKQENLVTAYLKHPDLVDILQQQNKKTRK